MAEGTTFEATVVRVVDGDTIRVTFKNDGVQREESLRILALDTEESQASGGKPVTPWGKKAAERAKGFFKPDDVVVLEFPGSEPLPACFSKYRGNFGRLLVFVHKEGVDFQEVMIKEGFSPYFVKYGNANFTSKHDAYRAAERGAQRAHIGVWDQVAVNGSEIRNYAALGTWWQLRASIIDVYRAERKTNTDLLNTRLDFDELSNRAAAGATATIFSEVRSIRRVGQSSGLIGIGSQHQPFTVFIPDITSDAGQRMVRLFENRYFPGDDAHPRRSYVYLTGELSVFDDKPQMVVTEVDQIADDPP